MLIEGVIILGKILIAGLIILGKILIEGLIILGKILIKGLIILETILKAGVGIHFGKDIDKFDRGSNHFGKYFGSRNIII